MVKIVVYIIVFCSLLSIIYYDFKEYIIPNIFNILLVLSGVILGVMENDISQRVLSSAVLAFPFIIIYCYGYDIFKRGPIGIGDIKLAISLGTIIKLSNLIEVVIFLNLTFISAMIFIIGRYFIKRELPKMIPLGPFIIFATFIFMVFEV